MRSAKSLAVGSHSQRGTARDCFLARARIAVTRLGADGLRSGGAAFDALASSARLRGPRATVLAPAVTDSLAGRARWPTGEPRATVNSMRRAATETSATQHTHSTQHTTRPRCSGDGGQRC